MREMMFPDEVALPRHWPDEEKTVSVKKIAVPDEMLKAAVAGLIHCWDRIPTSTDYSSKQVKLSRAALEAGLLWLSDNPLSPTPDQAVEIAKSRFDDRVTGIGVATGAVEWQRRMFLASESQPTDFMECDTCRAKPGTPTLCAGCLHNRSLINELMRRPK
jgi:hypothetical protein